MPSFIPLNRLLRGLVPALLLLLFPLMRAQVQATTVPLILPGGLDYDASGNLYLAETGKHLVRKVTAAGLLTTVAGNGVQGFGGDGGPATSAMLDSPMAVAHDASGNLYLADAHNHRIRRIDAATGLISTFAGTGFAGSSADATAAVQARMDLPSALAFDAAGNLYYADTRAHLVRRIDQVLGLVVTVAGNGVEGFSGDGGPATAAAIDSPSGLAVDAAGNLYLADTHNHRVRRVDAATGVITSVAGTGQPGFGGDAGGASAARLSLPRGLAIDAQGNLLVVDSRNQRVRRVDAATGQITTIAGKGVQGFAGDGGPAVQAELDSPRAVALAPGGFPTIADSGNNRVRQVDAAADIQTLAGLGNAAGTNLTLAGATVDVYGTGSVTATLAGVGATGSVAFFDVVGGVVQSLGPVALAGNAATLSTAILAAGMHQLSAVYSGDAGHAGSQSGRLAVMVTPAPATATVQGASVLYGQAVPVLTGTLTGVLPRDAGQVTLAVSSVAGVLAPAGTYPITATLSGSAAANYAVTLAEPAALVVFQAPSAVTLTSGLAVHVMSTTAGVPTGAVNLLDGGVPAQTATLSATGDAVFSSATLSNGTHTLTAMYAGDHNFLRSTSTPEIMTIGAGADFTLSSAGASALTVTAGSAATYSFAMTPVAGALSSPVLLSASGLPAGATATFNPAYLPPGGLVTNFTLTIQTAKLAGVRWSNPLVFAGMLPVLLLLWKRRGRAVLVALLLGAVLGCGDRVNTAAVDAAGASYNVTVTGVATSAAGATLRHSVTVVLTVQ